MGVLRAKVGGEWVDIQTGIPASQLLLTEEGGANYPNASTISFRSGFDLSGGGGTVNVVLDLAEYTGAALPLASGGTGATTQADARTALGLGTMAVRANVSTADLQDNAVTNAKLADIGVANRIKGAVTVGDPQDLNPVQVRSIIASDSSGTGTPNTLFFRGDGIWAIPAPGIDVEATQTVAAALLTSGVHSRITAVYEPAFDRVNLAFVDANLITISGLTPTSGNIIQSVGGTWASQTPTQVKTALALNNVENTADINKIVSTAQNAADLLRVLKTGDTMTGALTTTNVVTVGPASTVFNENGVDSDTRIEGDTDVNLFFADASTDRIGIGTATPAYKFDVTGAGRFTGTLLVPNGVLAGEAVNKSQLDLKLNLTGGTITGLTTFSAAAPVVMNSSLNVIGTTSLAATTVSTTLGVTGNVTMGGTLGVTGAVTAASFAGNGALLTALNATEITTGTLNRARLPSEIDANTTGWAKRWETGRLIRLMGEVTGSGTIRGDADLDITTVISPNSVALGTDTTGNYVAHIIGTTNRVTTDTVTAAEGTTHTLTLPQDIHTGATPQFARLNLSQVTGTAPMTVSSQTLVTNLNAQYLNSQTGADYHSAAMLTGLVHPDRVDGPYGKITRVGTLDQLTVTGPSVHTGATSFSQTPTVAGETMWHSGNDGHTGGGTGINADLLDGFHADYFAVDAEVEALMGDLLSVGLYDPAAYNNETYTLRFDRALQQAVTGMTIAAGDHPFDMRFELDIPVITQAELATTPRRRVIRNGVQLDIVRTGDDDHLNRALGLATTPKNPNLYVDQKVVFRAKLRKSDLDAVGMRQIARHGSTTGAYLNPAAGTATTPDMANMAITGPVRLSWRARYDSFSTTVASHTISKSGSNVALDREMYVYHTAGATSSMYFYTSNAAATTQVSVLVDTPALGVAKTYGVEFTPGSTAAVAIVDDVRSARTFASAAGVPNTAIPVTVGFGAVQQTGAIYWAQLETLDAVGGNPTGIVWRFDATEYSGAGTSYVDPRGRTWTLSNVSAIVSPPSEEAWTLYMDSGKLALRASPDGTSMSTVDVLSAAELDAITGTSDNTDFYVAAAVSFGTTTLDAQGWGSVDGVDWAKAGSIKSVAFPADSFYDSPGALSIGGADASQLWDGRIYWVDMVAGGTPETTANAVWSFDARDHPLDGGTTFNNPRGHTWTLSSASAVLHATLAVHSTITTNAAARTAISPALSNTLAAGQKYQIRGAWNAANDQVIAAWRPASVTLDDNATAWQQTATTFAGETMATPGAVVIGQATPASPNLSYGGAMYRIRIEKNFATILDLVPKNNIPAVGEATSSLTITPTVGPALTLSHYSMMTSTKPHPQWDKGPNVYWHNSYWICRSSGEVDFIDSDYSGRYDPATDKVVSLANGDWVIATDKDFGAPGHEQGTPQPYSQMVFQYIPFSSETYVKAQITAHIGDRSDPHSAAGYLKNTDAKTLYAPIVHTHEAEISGWINLHKEEIDPHPNAGYLTETTANELFLTPAEGDLLNFEPKGEVDRHEKKANPHPDYLTEAEGIDAFSPKTHLHSEYAANGHTHNFDDEVASSDGAESARIFVGETTPVNPTRGDLWIQTYNISLTAPVAPTGLTANTTSSSVTLTWAPWPTAAVQNVVLLEWSATGATPQAPAGTSGWTQLLNDVVAPYDTTYTHTGRAERVRYWYRVRAGNTIGVGAWGFVDATIPNTAPPAPAPAVSSTTPSSITITWPQVVVPATDPLHAQPYEVFRNGVSQGFTANEGTRTFTFGGLTENTTHTLGVRTRDSLGLLSPTVSVTGTVGNADPPAPTGLYQVGVNHYQYHMGWGAVTGITDFSRYQVFVNGGHWADTTGTDYLFSGLGASSSYTFGVRSVDTRNAVSAINSIGGTTSPNPDTTPPGPITLSAFRPFNNYGEMHVQWTQPETTARTIVYRNINGNGYEIMYDGGLASGTLHSVYLGTFGAGTTIYTIVRQWDANGNVQMGDQYAYTLVSSPAVFSPTGSNTYRVNGEWGVVGSKKVYQGYYNNPGLNAYGSWFYGRQFLDWWRAGRTITGFNIFANREGCGVNQEDHIYFWLHTRESDPGMGFGLGEPQFLGGGGHDGGTLKYNTAKWMALPVQWAYDLCGGWAGARGIGIYTGYYVCLRPAGDAYSGIVEIHHWG